MRRALLLVFLVSLAAAGTLVRAEVTAATAPAWRGARFLEAAGWWSGTGSSPARPPQAPVAQQAPPPVATSTLTLTSVLDWGRGTSTGLLVSNNSGGELRLDDGSKQGQFTSELTGTKTLFNAIGAVWQADVPAGTSLRLEVRGGASTVESELTPWQTLVAGDALSSDGAQALESVLPFPGGMAYLQLRATFGSTVNNATPELREIALTTLDATKGPPRQASNLRSLVPYGPATLTAAPQVVLRDKWGAPAPRRPSARQLPKGIVLHQIGSDDVVDPLPFLRAQAAYDIQTLGYDDVPFHFVLDRDGTIYVGSSGGPTAQVARLAGGDTAAIHVALIGGAPSGGQQAALVGLLAWLGQAYAIPPNGQHVVAGSPSVARPNIVAHGDVVSNAADRSDALHALVEQLRQSVDQATVRARWYFAEGNSENFSERLSALNLGAGDALITFRLLRQPGPAVPVAKTVGAGQRADVIVNDLFNDSTDVPAVVESNQPAIAERFMDFGADLSAAPGVRQLSRVWYFAEGSTETKTDSKTYLILFNPQSADASATITYFQEDGVTAQPDSVRIPAGERVVVTVGDTLPNKRFGARVIASQPIVAERTMIFGPGSTPSSGGVTTAPGVVTLSRHWYFAEGTTQPPFSTSILVLNPNAQPTNVKVTFLTDSGTSLERNYAVAALTRLSVDVNEVVPSLGIATTVEADRPIVAERAMYWSNSGGENSVGMANPGAIAPSFIWRFADGRTSAGYQEYLLLSNPNKNPARVTVEVVLADGKRATQTLPTIAPGSRYTMALHQYYPGQQAIAAAIQSTQPIVAERALYAGAPGDAANKGGDTALGVPEEQP